MLRIIFSEITEISVHENTRQDKENWMKIIYRAAHTGDADAIFGLVQNAIKQMESNNIFQWDSIYPDKEDFEDDIRKNCAYVGLIDERIAVVYALNRECDEQYSCGSWQYDGDDHIVIHRLCVSPEFQNMGVAGITMRHIEDDMRGRGIKAIRLDVFSENPYAVRLYQKNGYHRVGTANWRKGEFYLMEKLL